MSKVRALIRESWTVRKWIFLGSISWVGGADYEIIEIFGRAERVRFEAGSGGDSGRGGLSSGGDPSGDVFIG